MNQSPMDQPLTTEALEGLRHIDACLLANAIETFHERLRNEGFVDRSVRCIFPEFQAMAGFAATLKIRGSDPPTADGCFPERTDWWDYVLSVPNPRVVVIQDVSERPGLGSMIGGLHMNILRRLNCVGVVTNGSVRDIPAAREIGFHLFAGGISVSHAYVHIVEVGQPVEIGGMKVQSGDLLHGDLHGVQSVPLDIAERVPAVAAAIRAQKQLLIDFCRSKEFTLKKAREALSKPIP